MISGVIMTGGTPILVITLVIILLLIILLSVIITPRVDVVLWCCSCYVYCSVRVVASVMLRTSRYTNGEYPLLVLSL